MAEVVVEAAEEVAVVPEREESLAAGTGNK
jgi:hypothetical protein